MNSEYIIRKDEIRAINGRYGGDLRTDAEIETALDLGKGKGILRKVAYLWKAILVGHPFTDANKRTAMGIALIMFDACNIKTNRSKKENMVSTIRKIASENITDIDRIERLVRYAAEEV